MIWQIWMKCEMIRKIWKKSKLKSEKIWKIWKKSKLNSEMIWKIWKISVLVIITPKGTSSPSSSSSSSDLPLVTFFFQCPMFNCHTLICSSFLNIRLALKRAVKIRWLDSWCDVIFTVTSSMNHALSKARSGLKSLKIGSLDMQGLNKSSLIYTCHNTSISNLV